MIKKLHESGELTQVGAAEAAGCLEVVEVVVGAIIDRPAVPQPSGCRG
jgi:hypothetical protein